MSDYLAKSQEYTTKLLEWKVKRKDTVRLIRSPGQEIQRNHKNVNIAKLTGASASIVGAGLGIGGFVAAFFTFGTSLILTAIGTGIAAGGGLTVGGSVLTEHLLSKSDVKVVQAALDDDRKATWELAEFTKKIKPSSYFRVAGGAAGIGVAVGTGVNTAAITGARVAVAAERGGQALFRTLGTVGKVFHCVGFAASVVFIPLDIYTLVETSIDVHRGSIPKVVDEINKMADALEAELRQMNRRHSI